MRASVRLLLPLLLLALAPVAATAQAPADTAVVLELVTADGQRLALRAADWARLPQQTVRAADPGGPGHAPIRGAFTGVPLRALLTRMGVPEGPALRGAALRAYLVAEASDGYVAVFALPELDPGFTRDPVIVADRRDGARLNEHEGPLRILAPADGRPARWVRDVVRLTLHRLP